MFRFELPLSICVLGVLGACSRSVPALVVGSKTSVEQVFLAEVAAQQLERKLGQRVTRKFNWGEATAVHTALAGGEIDVYPENGCVAMGTILRVDLSTERSVILERARGEYRTRFGSFWLDPLGFDGRTQAAVPTPLAAQFKIRKLSDLASRKEGWSVGMAREFRNRKDGFPLLEARYRIPLHTPPVAVESHQFARALADDKIDLVVAGATDIVWLRDDLQVLEDDLQVIPPCEVSFVLRADAEQAHPGARAALAELSGKFRLETVREANLRLSDGRVSIEAAVEKFLGEVAPPR